MCRARKGGEMSLDPYLSQAMVLVECLVQRYIARHGHRMTQTSGSLNDLYVSFQEARQVLDRGSVGRQSVSGREGWPSEVVCNERLAMLEMALGQHQGQTEGKLSPLERLRRVYFRVWCMTSGGFATSCPMVEV